MNYLEEILKPNSETPFNENLNFGREAEEEIDSFFSFDDLFDWWPSSSSSTLSGSKLSDAISYNQKYANRIGWGKYYDEIVSQVLKLNYSPNEENFAQAVAKWQSQNGYSGNQVDGKLGPGTWGRMQRSLSTRIPSLPAPTQPGGSASRLKRNIVRIAKEEWNKWNRGSLKETNPRATPLLKEYYARGIGSNPSTSQLQSRSWQSNHPWSAVFISFVMKKAGAGGNFRYSAAHWRYIAAAKRNRVQQNNQNPFWAYRLNEVKPEVGDLVCKSRKGSRLNYDNIERGGATHCDIVTDVKPGRITIVGGNVNNSVNDKTLQTDSSGYISQNRRQSEFFAIIKVR